MRDESEVQDAPASKLKPANENPWYVLMTLYGDDHERNRKAWNYLYGKSEVSGNLWQQELSRRYNARLPNEEPFGHPKRLPDRGDVVDLRSVDFEERLNLSGFHVSQHIDVSGATFRRGVDTTGTIFKKSVVAQNVVFQGPAYFDFSIFGEGVNFGDSVFCNVASFEEVDVTGNFEFEHVSVSKTCGFHRCNFRGIAHFDLSSFYSDVSFYGSRFLDRVSFTKVCFLGLVKEACEVNFEGAQFENSTSFRGAIFFDQYPIISGALLHDKTEFTARLRVKETEEGDPTQSHGSFYWPIRTKQDFNISRETCATIRHILAKQGLPEDEHFFFRREMYFAGKIGSIWQRLPYLLFGLFSDYGHSIARPTFWLAGIWAFGLVAFWGYLAGCCVPAPLGVVERPMGTAMGLSFSNLFPLFGFGRTFLAAELAGLPAVLKVISGFQTIFSLPLLFFLGLGLRQRFRLR